MENTGEIIGSVIVLMMAIFFYFLPSVVGSKKKNANAIFVMNLFLGWSVIGWIIALIWATTKD